MLVFVLGTFIAPYFSAQRLVLPELVGEDSATLTQANAVVGDRLPADDPPRARSWRELLIASIGATNVLYVDAATYAVSFVLLLFFVPKRPPLPASDGRARRVRRPSLRRRSDRCCVRCSLTVVFLHMFAQSIFVALPVLAFVHYGASARTAGLLFGAFGAGSIIGASRRSRWRRRMPPLTLATIGIVWVSAPLLLLGLELPAVGVMAVLFAAGLGAVATAPLIAIITTRSPGRAARRR